MKKIIQCVLVALLFAQCINNTPVETSAMNFVPQIFLRESSLCFQGDSQTCARVKLDFVLAEGGDEAARKIINDSIVRFLGYSMHYGETEYDPAKGLDGTADIFIQDYERISKEDTDLTPWEIQSSLQPLAQYDSTVTFGLSSYNYTGGAHGNYFAIFLNFNEKTGKLLRSEDVFEDKAGLSPLLENAARAFYEIPEGQSLQDFGFYYEGETFPVNNNFCLMQDSITFVYNPYEIAPYAMGQMSLKLAKKDIAGYLK